ncbi:MAG TPA: hypothetical protein VFM21_11210 [Terriglobia bacterium]|nr:hypothetical protein [Terriglobia bacterium]
MAGNRLDSRASDFRFLSASWFCHADINSPLWPETLCLQPSKSFVHTGEALREHKPRSAIFYWREGARLFGAGSTLNPDPNRSWGLDAKAQRHYEIHVDTTF